MRKFNWKKGVMFLGLTVALVAVSSCSKDEVPVETKLKKHVSSEQASSKQISGKHAKAFNRKTGEASNSNE